MKNSERAEAVERVVEAIRALPDDGYCFCLTGDTGHSDDFGTGADLKALVESHERRGEALKQADNVIDLFRNNRGDSRAMQHALSRYDIASEAMKGG